MDLPEDDAGRKMELCDGRVIFMSQPGEQHGIIAGNIYDVVKPFVRAHALGLVYFDTGFRIRRAPDRVVNPDLAFVAGGRLDPGRDRTRAVGLAPTLAVEVVSPNDRDHDVGAKVLEYLEAGSDRVWVVRPESRTVTVYRADGSANIQHEAAVLSSDDAGFAADGFELRVAEIFA